MKKIISLILCSLMIISVFSGCSDKLNNEKNGKLSIVTTVFPQYDWVRQIVGDNVNNVDITLLLDDGVDLHSYQPTADDIIKISTCDMFIYVGGESDEWVEDALKEAVNKDIVVIDLMDTLGNAVKEEEVVEGMQAEEDDTDEDETEYDEHIWLSLKNATVLCQYISDKLCEIDVANKERYIANAEAYIEKLSKLDLDYKTAVDNASVKTVLFGDRFPFRYLTEDYGLNYYAAFSSCSAETEASFETIVFLANKIDELGLKAIMQIESSDGSVANTIREATALKNQKILTMDSMQSTLSSDIQDGITYLSVMESNLEVLKKAIN